MENRLGDLLGGEGSDVEAPRTKVQPTAPNDFMSQFFKEVGSINLGMSTIRANMELIQSKHAEILSTISQDDQKRATQQAEELMNRTGAEIKSVKGRLEKMKGQVTRLEEPGADPNHLRMASSMHGTLTRKFIDVVGEYNELQNIFKNEYRAKIERQVRIVNPNATPEQVDSIMEGGGDVFSQELLRAGHAQATQAYLEAQEKNRDIQAIEAQLRELHQLFTDLHTLVEAQGHVIDSIEHNVSKTVVYVEKGVKQMVKANKYQRSARKKMCCLGILIAIIGIALALGVGLS